MDKDRAKYIMEKADSIANYKKAYLAFKNAADVLQKTYNISSQEFELIQAVALKEQANSHK